MSLASQPPNGPARTVSAEQLATERLLRAAVEASRELLAADLDAGLRGALRALGEGTGLDRVYAVRYDHAARAGFFVAEHCAPGIASVTAVLGAGPYGYADYEEVWRPLVAGEIYTSPVAAKTGANAELNQAAGTKSDLFVPVFVGGVFWGALGFDDCTTERVYCDAEIQVLRAAAAALAAALGRATVEAALHEAETESRMRIHRWFEITGEGAWSARIDPPVPVTLPVDEQVRAIIAGAVLTDCNELGAVMMGYASAADWIGRRATDFFPANPANLAYLSAFVAGGHRIRDVESNDGAPDGRDRWFLNNLNGMLHGGALVGLYGTHRDITPLKLADAQMRRLERERADEAMALNHLLEGVVAASRALLDEPDFQSGLERWLAALAGAVDADRAIVGQFAAPDDPLHVAINQISWTKPGLPDVFHEPVPASSDFVAWAERLQRGESVWAHRDELLDARSVRYWEETDCFTNLLVPVVVDRRTVAWLCFDWRARREWKPAYGTLLRTAADGAAAAIKRNEAVRAMLAEREGRAADLAALNRELEQRNRLLAAAARASALLSAREDFDAAVVEAMGVVAEAAEFDRIVLVEHLDAHGNPGAEFWRVTHEWQRPGVMAQQGSEVTGGSFADAPVFIAEMMLDERVLEFTTPEIPDEGFRRVQETLGARLLVAGSIFVDGFSWGAFGCDDCRTARRRTAEEKGVIAAAARAVGQAVYRRRLEERAKAMKRQIDAEREKAALELTLANHAMNRALASLAVEPDVGRVPAALLLEITRIADAELAHWFEFDAEKNTLESKIRIKSGKILSGPEKDEPEFLSRPFRADITPGFALMCESDKLWLLDARDAPSDAWWPETHAWHRRNGMIGVMVTALKVGAKPIGAIGLAFGHALQLTTAQIELIRALSNQFALAAKVMRLGDQARGAAVLAERNRIARDLHDTLAQGFTGVLAQLGAAEGAVEAGQLGVMNSYLERAKALARFSLAEARSSVHALRPEANPAPLATRLRQMLAGMTHGTGLVAAVEECGIAGELGPAADWCVHKFVQEALANAVKHSGAKIFRVELGWGVEFSACVWDDGRGFDPAKTPPGLGMDKG